MMHATEVKQRGCGTKIYFNFLLVFQVCTSRRQKSKKIVNDKAVITFHVVLSFSWL